MKKLAVVAFGGNALLRAGQKGTIDEQEVWLRKYVLPLTLWKAREKIPSSPKPVCSVWITEAP